MQEFHRILVFQRDELLSGRCQSVDLEPRSKIKREAANLKILIVADRRIILSNGRIIFRHIREQARLLIIQQAPRHHQSGNGQLLQRLAAQISDSHGGWLVVVRHFTVHDDNFPRGFHRQPDRQVGGGSDRDADFICAKHLEARGGHFHGIRARRQILQLKLTGRTRCDRPYSARCLIRRFCFRVCNHTSGGVGNHAGNRACRCLRLGKPALRQSESQRYHECRHDHPAKTHTLILPKIKEKDYHSYSRERGGDKSTGGEAGATNPYFKKVRFCTKIRKDYGTPPTPRGAQAMAIATINPATGEVVKRFDALTDAQVDDKITTAAAAFHSFRKTPFADRTRWMTKAAEILESDKEAIGRLMTLEMGKTLLSAIAEAEKCAATCRYYAENAARFVADEPIATSAAKSFIRYQPIGIVLAVMPWNFPFWQVFRFVAPGLMAGNVGLLKHASNVPQCALKIEEIVRRAGFPEGVFQTLLIGASQVDRILNDPRVAAATLTGSEQAGIQVGISAAKRIKKVVLEL